MADATAAVRALLAEFVDSFEKLEILIHLHDANSAVRTTTEIGTALSIPDHVLIEPLSELVRDGLVAPAPNGWALDTSARQATSIDALAKLYTDDRMEVLKLMTALALERVRAKTAQRFADAFLIRLKKDKGEPDA